MIKAESKFHSRLMKWIQYNKNLLPDESFLFETKIARKNENRFTLSELSEKERRLLRQAKRSGILQTHSDFGGMGTNCDGSMITGGGYIFIQWYRPRNNVFYAIDIDDLEKYEKKHGIKSLTEEMADKICFIKSELK